MPREHGIKSNEMICESTVYLYVKKSSIMFVSLAGAVDYLVVGMLFYSSRE